MTYAMTEPSSALELVQLGEPTSDSTWLVSDWNAGQTHIMRWTEDNVRIAKDGAVELVLDAAPVGADRPYEGGEFQSSSTASAGTWSWLAQAPEMQDGAVFGMFLYQADWQHDRWLEFDFEFVGSDTTQVELNIHMEDAEGRHIVLEDGPLVIDLGFDAAEAMHLYEIELTGTEAIFSIDEQVVATFDASDMPGDTWYSGKVRSMTDLWAAAPAQAEWTGEWNYDGEPLVARIADAGTPRNPLDTAAWQPEETVAPEETDSASAPAPDPVEEPPVAGPVPENTSDPAATPEVASKPTEEAGTQDAPLSEGAEDSSDAPVSSGSHPDGTDHEPEDATAPEGATGGPADPGTLREAPVALPVPEDDAPSQTGSGDEYASDTPAPSDSDPEGTVVEPEDATVPKQGKAVGHTQPGHGRGGEKYGDGGPGRAAGKTHTEIFDRVEEAACDAFSFVGLRGAELPDNDLFAEGFAQIPSAFLQSFVRFGGADALDLQSSARTPEGPELFAPHDMWLGEIGDMLF